MISYTSRDFLHREREKKGFVGVDKLEERRWRFLAIMLTSVIYIYIFLEVWESVANTGLDRATPLISINAENAEED